MSDLIPPDAAPLIEVMDVPLLPVGRSAHIAALRAPVASKRPRRAFAVAAAVGSAHRPAGDGRIHARSGASRRRARC